METQQITIWAGYIGRTKNVGEGFATVLQRSAHIISGQVFVRQASDEELEVEPDDRCFICFPGATLGSAHTVEWRRIGCKSAGHAAHILNRKGWLAEQLKDTNWFVNPQAAAKYAYDELMAAAEFDSEKPESLQEAIERLRAADILKPNQTLSARWFKKPLSRIRIVNALRGDKMSLGLIRRDCCTVEG